MNAARSAAAILAAVCPMGFASAAGAVDWMECPSRDRAALLESALLWEVTAVVRYANAPVTCVVVGVAEFEMEKAVDPPAAVVSKVARAAQRRVVPVSKSGKCPGAPKTFVSEPRCAGLRGIVGTLLKNHCPLVFEKSGPRWIDVTPRECA